MASKGELPGQAKALARALDYERYLTALFAPRQARTAVFALVALNAELARIRHVVSEPVTGEVRLLWWREALEKLEQGEVLRQPALEVLAPLVREGRLPVETLTSMVEARYAELEPPAYATLKELEEARSAVLHPYVTAVLHLLDSPKSQGSPYRAALAYNLVGLARNLRGDASRGRCFVPLDALRREGLDPVTALHPANEAALSRAVARVMARADALAKSAGAERDGKALPILLEAALARHHLKRLEKAGFNPFRLPASEQPLRRFLAVWIRGITWRP